MSAGLLFAVLLCVTGCSSGKTGNPAPRPGSGIAEYRRVVTDAQQAMGRALASLATVSAQSNRCSPEVFAAFNHEFQRLQVESVQIRARSQAMQARGDAYFQQWHGNLARVPDPELRARAERERPALEAAFVQIKQLSTEARGDFNPFLADLRTVRNSLEADPANLATDTTQKAIATAREHGEHVERCLAAMRRELDSMSQRLGLPVNTPKAPNAG